MTLYIPEWLKEKNVQPNTKEHWDHVLTTILTFDYEFIFEIEDDFNRFMNLILNNDIEKSILILAENGVFDLENFKLCDILKESWFCSVDDIEYINTTKLLKKFIYSSTIITSPFKLSYNFLEIEKTSYNNNTPITFFDKFKNVKEYGVEISYKSVLECAEHVTEDLLTVYFKNLNDYVYMKLLT